MANILLNLYEIENLKELNCKYRLYSITGFNLDPSDDDYEKNLQLLVDKLSRRTKSPCIITKEKGKIYIAQPDGFQKLPHSFDLVRTKIRISENPEMRELEFNNLNEKTSSIAIRFLQFSLQNPLKQNPVLWQPRSGYPFYNKIPDRNFRDSSKTVDLYRGFKFRVVVYENGKKIGLCVDTSNKYIARDYLPSTIERAEFRQKYSGLNCLYEYGNVWYEVKLEGRSESNISEIELPDGKTLYELINTILSKSKNSQLKSLPDDCTTLYYRNSFGDPRNIPSSLCKLTYSTNHPEIKKYHNVTLKLPHNRLKEIEFVVSKYLRKLKFGNVVLKLSENPVSTSIAQIKVPDLEFGNNKVITFNNSKHAENFPFIDLGKKKKDILYDSDFGLYVQKQFDRQYIILPRSVYETYGKKFIEELKYEVERLYSKKSDIFYNPIEIPYNDSVQKTISKIGNEIIKSVESNASFAGYGLVMLPRLSSDMTKEDELANLVHSELRKRDIQVSIIHTSVGNDSYVYNDSINQWSRVENGKQKGILSGYLKNVALNKILLLNNHWPFILHSMLNADLTIGIDVKNHTAGFTVVYKSGKDIRFFSSESDQREQLSKKHLEKIIFKIVKEEQQLRTEQELEKRKIKNIVIHRDGILHQSEIIGIEQAFNRLKFDNNVDRDAVVNFAEIRKSSRVPLRLFQTESPSGSHKTFINNPKIGTYFTLSEDEGFICTTGFPYRHKGSANPLHIKKIKGDLEFVDLLEDLFCLSNLTWTKIDDCSRYPITLKLTDIRLKSLAGEYSEDDLNFETENIEEGVLDE